MLYDFELAMSDYVGEMSTASTEAENAHIQAEIAKVDAVIAQHKEKITKNNVILAEQEKELQSYAAAFEQLKIPELKAKLAKTVAVVNKHELKCKGLNAKIDEVGAQFRAVEWVDPGEVEAREKKLASLKEEYANRKAKVEAQDAEMAHLKVVLAQSRQRNKELREQKAEVERLQKELKDLDFQEVQLKDEIKMKGWKKANERSTRSRR